MKFGVIIPKNCDEAERLDRENKNNLWDQAIKKELKNVKVAFQLLENDEPLPIGSTHIRYHIIFDVKYDLTRKSPPGSRRSQTQARTCTFILFVCGI